jgi:hypothetical protein
MQLAHTALRNAVNVRATADCPMCGNDGWAAGEALFQVAALDGDAPIETLAFVCRSCGFVRLHAVQPLETIDD